MAGNRRLYPLTFFTAIVFIVVGALLAAGGAYLVALKGSWYYVIAGAAIVLTGLLLLIQRAAARRAWDQASLPAMVLLGLIGNAIICGTFSNHHDRYQSRIVWLPSLVLLLAVTRDRRALQPAAESGT